MTVVAAKVVVVGKHSAKETYGKTEQVASLESADTALGKIHTRCIRSSAS